MISCGGHHTVAVTEDGHAVSWGWGSDGQLGRSHLSLLARSPSCECTHRHDIKSLAPILTQVYKSCSLLITFANIRRKRKHLRPGVANTDKGPVSAARKYNWHSRIFDRIKCPHVYRIISDLLNTDTHIHTHTYTYTRTMQMHTNTPPATTSNHTCATCRWQRCHAAITILPLSRRQGGYSAGAKGAVVN